MVGTVLPLRAGHNSDCSISVPVDGQIYIRKRLEKSIHYPNSFIPHVLEDLFFVYGEIIDPAGQLLKEFCKLQLR